MTEHPTTVPIPIDELTTHPLWTSSADGLALVDSDGAIQATNPAFDNLFGYPPDDLVGRSVESLVPPESQQAHIAHRESYEHSPRSRPMAASRLLDALREDGSTFPAAISLSRILTTNGEISMAAVRDLTARVRTETEVAKANRLRALAEDHDRIASELHDSVIQQLFAVGLSLQGLPPRIADTAASERVGQAVDTIDEIISRIRTTIHGLRAISEPDRSLRHRVLSIVTEMEPALQCVPEVKFQGDLEAITDAAVIDHLLPTLREALANVGRHADASAVTVSVTCDGSVELEVADDGLGIEPGVERSGLANLEARALSLGGSLNVTRTTPTGTKLRWQVPAGVELD